MSTRNKLLESIVLALGGTVTNPNNRNQLLEDWLNAVSGPATRLAPNFNGVSQAASVSIPVTTSSVIEFDFISSSMQAGFAALIDSTSSSNRIAIRASADGMAIQLIGCTGTIDGLPIVSNVTALPMDGISHTIVLTPSISGTIANIARNFANSVFFSGVLYNLKVGDGSAYNFPMDDGWVNNPVMRNTGSGADGTFINMTEAAWVEINE